jgi:hypothetical protein
MEIIINIFVVVLLIVICAGVIAGVGRMFKLW